MIKKEKKCNNDFILYIKIFKFDFNALSVSDEDLFKLCEGRTAHKGARHGIKMNGKLAKRI